MKRVLLILVASLFTGIIFSQCPKLIWADEFNGTELDQTKWSYQIGDGCDINLCQWGNSELQWYTSNKANVDVSNGTLKITAVKQTINNRNYTSGRIRSINKGDFKYGRIEARMKLPIGQGIWPAFWMLPTENVYGTWPKSGELDIMEYLGHEPNVLHATLHYGNFWPNNKSTTKSYTKPLSKLNDAFHEYVLEWKENEINWFIDGFLYATKTNLDLNGSPWPFDQKFHFLLNLAVGGNWPGNPNASTVFPQTFEIDYVKVYDMVSGPHIIGKSPVLAGSKNEEFVLQNVPQGSSVTWNLPEGIFLKSGQNSNKLIVDFTNKSGSIKANIKSPCQEYNIELEVLVQQGLATDIILENFDDQPRIKLTSSTGTLTAKTANPNKFGVNTSDLSGRYVRNTSSQYDILVYDISDVKLGSDFVSGEKKFYIDMYTNAPIGTELLLQLEDKNSAQGSNYPVGRHSRYSVKTNKTNEWERLSFNFLDKPSNAVSDFSINQLIFLFSPNSNNGSTYFFDNFEIYSRKTTPLRSAIDSKNFKIYPNPFTNSLNIKSTYGSLGKIDLSLYNTQGQYVMKKSFDSFSDIVLNTSQLERGIYFLNLDTAKGHVSRVVSKW